MKYYKIILGGKGAEVFPFKLNTEQYETLRDKGVEHDELDYDEICKILGVELFFDCPEETIMGPYPDNMFIRVEDEEGNVVYQSEDFDNDKFDYEEQYCGKDAYLMVEDYCKGNHIEYDIPLEEDFDIEKLRLKVDDVGCRVEVISGILYEEKDYKIYKSYGKL